MHLNDYTNIFTAVVALIAAILGFLNRQQLGEVHQLTNSRFSRVEDKLKEALAEIGRMRGEPAKSIVEAPYPAGTHPDPASATVAAVNPLTSDPLIILPPSRL